MSLNSQWVGHCELDSTLGGELRSWTPLWMEHCESDSTVNGILRSWTPKLDTEKLDSQMDGTLRSWTPTRVRHCVVGLQNGWDTAELTPKW